MDVTDSCEPYLLKHVVRKPRGPDGKRTNLDLNHDFGAARRAPPEDLRLRAGSYGVNNSVNLGARPRCALKVISKIHSKSNREPME